MPQYPHILSPRVLPPDVPASFGYHLLPWQADNDVEGAPPSVSNTVSASGSLTAAAPSATPSEDGEDSLSGREHLTYDNAVKECQKACGPWLKRLKEEGRCLSWSPAGNATGADEITRDGVALACTGKRVASLALFCEVSGPSDGADGQHLDEASQCGECVSDLLGAPFEMMGSQLNSARKECKEGGYSFPVRDPSW